MAGILKSTMITGGGGGGGQLTIDLYWCDNVLAPGNKEWYTLLTYMSFYVLRLIHDMRSFNIVAVDLATNIDGGKFK